MSEMPSISAVARASNVYDNCGTNMLQNWAGGSSSSATGMTVWGAATALDDMAMLREQSVLDVVKPLIFLQQVEKHPIAKSNMPQQAQRRIVQVFIVDPDQNVPLDKAVLHKGDEQLTELLDNELFFECPVKDTLAKHNEYRATLLDKEASKKAGKDIHLEPIKIRDLKMVVVVVATF